MSEAPKEIVAGVDYENFNGTRLRMGCVTVGTDGVPMPFDPTHYIRRDIHRALLKAEREKALREAAGVCPNVIKSYDMLKPGKPDQYASREAQIVAKGFARLIEEDILALISDKTDG